MRVMCCAEGQLAQVASGGVVRQGLSALNVPTRPPPPPYSASCSAPHAIQSQLSEVFKIIAYCDYPER